MAFYVCFGSTGGNFLPVDYGALSTTPCFISPPMAYGPWRGHFLLAGHGFINVHFGDLFTHTYTLCFILCFSIHGCCCWFGLRRKQNKTQHNTFHHGKLLHKTGCSCVYHKSFWSVPAFILIISATLCFLFGATSCDSLPFVFLPFDVILMSTSDDAVVTSYLP